MATQENGPDQQHLFIPCPVRQFPLFNVVPDGIEIKCRSCRGEIHHISRSFLEKIWEMLAPVRDQAPSDAVPDHLKTANT